MISYDIVFCVLAVISGFTPYTGIPVKRLLYYPLFFYLGMRYDNEIRKHLRQTSSMVLLGMVSAVLLVLCRNCSGAYNNIPVANLVIAFSISLFLSALFQQYHVIGKNTALIFFGRHSLEIYLLHAYFCTLARALLSRTHADSNAYVSVALAFAAGIAGPLAIVRMLKNVPLCKKFDLYEMLFRPYYFLIQKTGRHEKI